MSEQEIQELLNNSPTGAVLLSPIDISVTAEIR